MRKIVLPGMMGFVFCQSFMHAACAGYSFSPLITILEPMSGKASAVVEIKFEGDVKAPVALELKLKGREISLDGKVGYIDDKSADKFVIYPCQIVLMPNDLQRVQVQWVGDSVPQKEIAYGLICEQAPIKVGDEDKPQTKAVGRVNILTRYEGIVVVRPRDVKPNTIVESAEATKDSTSSPCLSLTLYNTGTGLQKLAGMILQISPLNSNGKVVPGKSIKYRPELEREKIKHSLFAGYKRKFDLPWPPGLPVGPIRAAVDFNEAK